jgi:hypothetical protein
MAAALVTHAPAEDTRRPVLHVTNGDSAAQRLRVGGVGRQVLPWRDVLHEGPVPAGLDEDRLRVARATFLAGLGWAAEDRVLADMSARDARLDGALAAGEELVLWFEADLYDMLQLAQILDRLAGRDVRARLAIAGEREFTGVAELDDAELQAALEGAETGGRIRVLPVTAPLAAAGAAVWAAFRAPEPDALEPLAAPGGTPPLPALGEAVARHLAQFPWRGSGLNRTERILLEVVAEGAATPVEAFTAQQRAEERPFMGDATVFAYLRRLAAGRGALIDHGPPLALTELGRAVLAGAREWEERPELWLGGVRLPDGPARWRYDPVSRRLVSS